MSNSNQNDSFSLLDKTDDSLVNLAFEKFQIGNKFYYANSEDIANMDYTSEENIISPISLNQNCIQQAGAYTDFIITSAGVHKIDQMTLTMKVRNANAAVAQTLPFSYIIQRIELLADSKVVETKYSPNLFSQTILSTSETLALRALSEDFSTTTYSEGTGIAGNSTRTYYLIIDSFMNKIFLPTCNDLKVRVYMLGSGCQNTASPVPITDLTVQSANVLLQGRKYDMENLNRLIERFRSASHISSTLVNRFQTINLGSIVAGSTVSQTLSAFGNGHYVYLRFVMQNGGANNQFLLPAQYLSFQDISLIDSSGAPYSFQNIEDSYIRNVLTVSKWNSLATSVVKQLELDFAVNPAQTINSGGVDSGSRWLDGRWLIRINPASTAPSADLLVMSSQYALLIQHANGTVEIREN